jgi:hypothetical protein
LQSILLTEACLKNLEEAGKTTEDAHHKMDEKLDSIHRMIIQSNSGSEFGSAQKIPTHLHHLTTTS